MTRTDPPPLPHGRRFPVVTYAALLILIVLFAAAPIISVVISSWIAQANGCVLNEGGVNPCVINGTDWGETLTTMFVFGWLTFLTAPLGAIALLIWLIALVLHVVAHRRRRAALPK